jgi:hypothetical protein
MDTAPQPDANSTPDTRVQDQIHLSDPHSYLHRQLRVKGEQGKPLGKVDAVERDATGILTGIIVRHGLLGRKRTRVPVERIKQVNDDAVVIEFNAARLNRLPRTERH